MKRKEQWQALRGVVKAADFTLDERAFSAVLDLFRAVYAAGAETPAGETSEYAAGAQEYMLVVDANGKPVPLAPAVLDTYRSAVVDDPALAEWFRPDHLPDGQQVLLAARWLCHLAGLRHLTVEIFIDPPQWIGYTLVQVRSMRKFEAPGALDIPCAGHIGGIDEPEVALRKELREELNLTLDSLDDIRLLGQYNAYSEDMHGESVNNERRVLYRASLRLEAVQQVQFADGEVAGLAVFNIEELRRLVERYPERIASGLRGAMNYL